MVLGKTQIFLKENSHHPSMKTETRHHDILTHEELTQKKIITKLLSQRLLQPLTRRRRPCRKNTPKEKSFHKTFKYKHKHNKECRVRLMRTGKVRFS